MWRSQRSATEVDVRDRSSLPDAAARVDGKLAFANNAARVAAKDGLRGFAEALHLKVGAPAV